MFCVSNDGLVHKTTKCNSADRSVDAKAKGRGDGDGEGGLNISAALCRNAHHEEGGKKGGGG